MNKKKLLLAVTEPNRKRDNLYVVKLFPQHCGETLSLVLVCAFHFLAGHKEGPGIY